MKITSGNRCHGMFYLAGMQVQLSHNCFNRLPSSSTHDRSNTWRINDATRRDPTNENPSAENRRSIFRPRNTCCEKGTRFTKYPRNTWRLAINPKMNIGARNPGLTNYHRYNPISLLIVDALATAKPCIVKVCHKILCVYMKLGRCIFEDSMPIKLCLSTLN